MGAIWTTRAELLGTTGEIVGRKAGLALTRTEMRDAAQPSDRELLDGSMDQVLRCFAILAAFLFFLCNIALLWSVICRRTARSSAPLSSLAAALGPSGRCPPRGGTTP